MAMLNVGCNWTWELIEGLCKRTSSTHTGVNIASVYGSVIGPGRLGDNPFRTARPDERLRVVDDMEFVSMVDTLHAAGIDINYTINANCIPVPELFTRGGQLISRAVDWLLNMSVYADSFTVAHPLVIEAVQRHTSVPIECSIIMDIRTLGQLHWIKDHWPSVARVCISLDRNRDFAFLREASKMHKQDTAPDLDLLVNEFCSIGGHSCSGLFRQSCYMAHSHGYFMQADNYPMSRCTASRWKRPASWLCAPFILPQWLSFYTDLGVRTFKISGRTHPTEYILSIVDAYLRREYRGNLLGLWAQLESIWNTAKGQEEAVSRLNIPVELLDSCSPGGQFLRRFGHGSSCQSLDCGRTCTFCDRVFDNIQAKLEEE
jgi:collagenase-like PrtC family protease